MQYKREKDSIGYINYSMLRTNIMDKKYDYVVDSYSKYWYFDKENCNITYDASWSFKFLEEFGDTLQIERKKYMNKIITTDVEKIIIKDANLYNKKIINIARAAMPYSVRLKEFKELIKEEIVEIRVGDYRGMSEVVYKYGDVI
jgi:predicted HTH domain antitoxin